MESLRKAIKIAERWAAQMRMRLNVGPGKSAVLAYGRGVEQEGEAGAAIHRGN